MAETPDTIVLVSGGNNGIGYETVKKLGLENPSYHIFLGSRDLSKGEAAASSLPKEVSVEPIQLDVTSDESISACLEAIKNKYGRLDVLINNAGLLSFSPDIRERYTEVLSVNATGAACLTEASLPLMRESSNPRIVFVSSSLGSLTVTSTAYTDRPMEYRVSKAAMNMIAVCYSKRLEKEGFQVNISDPGVNATNLTQGRQRPGYTPPHPSNGAINSCRLATLPKATENGTFTSKEKQWGW